jgi:hypothetical protein
MRSERPGHSANAGVDTSVVWLLSFGDLLTLLACAFLILTPRLAQSRKDPPQKELLKAVHGSVESDGTELAIHSLEVSRAPSKPVLLTLPAEGTGSTAEEINMLAAELSAVRSQIQAVQGTVKVSVCKAQYRFELVSNLYRELQAVTGEERELAFELMSNCDQLSKTVAPRRSLIAVVEIL